MSDFFARLAQRVRGETTLARPRLPSVFEGPGWSARGAEAPVEVAGERGVRGPAADEPQPRASSELRGPAPAALEGAPAAELAAPAASTGPARPRPSAPHANRAVEGSVARRSEDADDTLPPSQPRESKHLEATPPSRQRATPVRPPADEPRPAVARPPEAIPPTETLAPAPAVPDLHPPEPRISPPTAEREPTLPLPDDRPRAPGAVIDVPDRAGPETRRAPSARPLEPRVEPPGETTVRVTIGSIVVRAASEPSRPKSSRPRPPAPRRLEDYLERRGRRGR